MGDKDSTHLFTWFLHIDTHTYSTHILIYSDLYIHTILYIYIRFEDDDEEGFVEEPNHISAEDDIVYIDDEEEEE